MSMETMRGPEQGADLLRERTDRMAAARDFVEGADGDTRAAIGLRLEARLGGDPVATDKLTLQNAPTLCPNEAALVDRLNFIMNDPKAPQSLKDAAKKISDAVAMDKDILGGAVLTGKALKEHVVSLVKAEGAETYDVEKRKEEQEFDKRYQKGVSEGMAQKLATEEQERARANRDAMVLKVMQKEFASEYDALTRGLEKASADRAATPGMQQYELIQERTRKLEFANAVGRDPNATKAQLAEAAQARERARALSHVHLDAATAEKCRKAEEAYGRQQMLYGELKVKAEKFLDAQK